MTEPVSADAIREDIRASLRRLRRLGDEGRIVMAEDSWNVDWHDSRVAIEIAAAALERADTAMLWMHTLPHPDGGYPPIPD
ncbi:hypothetical protein B7R22_13785 [Subtercola boreus]|uniref:Uncharacterized protein n=1 Tax=Subtercola boreus TaxID=120213 RepID=A0A3E0VV63_9MICO|nr:hypothetical protein [Subtercola boreus]RFA13233.1 hypothetical protein B7R22_13785 [Subtercola boreus]